MFKTFMLFTQVLASGNEFQNECIPLVLKNDTKLKLRAFPRNK